MANTNATKQALVTAFVGLGDRISMHTADPGTTGANEATGGSPAYARKQTTWAAGANGVKVGSKITADVPAGTYTHAGMWSSGGTFISGGPILDSNGSPVSLVFTTQGLIDFTPTTTVV